MSDLKREVWIAEWHDKHGKGNLSGYAFHSEDAAKSHIAQQLAEDEIRAKNGRARAWEGATWTTSRFVPAEPEQAGKAQGWHRVPELPLVGQECDLPDSDTTVLISPAPFDELNSDDYRLAQLEFTDDSEGHGKPYWSEPHGVEHSFEDYPFWTLPAPPTKDPTNG